jgi:hypothetical protein
LISFTSVEALHCLITECGQILAQRIFLQMSVAEIAGFAISIAGTPADHTYVVIGNATPCGCFGRSSGGHTVCSGVGNIEKSLCLAQPNTYAGVRYGVTGVCHQAANRILWPSGLTVTKAKGTKASYFIWGVYGRHDNQKIVSGNEIPWPELIECDSKHNHNLTE